MFKDISHIIDNNRSKYSAGPGRHSRTTQGGVKAGVGDKGPKRKVNSSSRDRKVNSGSRDKDGNIKPVFGHSKRIVQEQNYLNNIYFPSPAKTAKKRHIPVRRGPPPPYESPAKTAKKRHIPVRRAPPPPYESPAKTAKKKTSLKKRWRQAIKKVIAKSKNSTKKSSPKRKFRQAVKKVIDDNKIAANLPTPPPSPAANLPTPPPKPGSNDQPSLPSGSNDPSSLHSGSNDLPTPPDTPPSKYTSPSIKLMQENPNIVAKKSSPKRKFRQAVKKVIAVNKNAPAKNAPKKTTTPEKNKLKNIIKKKMDAIKQTKKEKRIFSQIASRAKTAKISQQPDNPEQQKRIDSYLATMGGGK
tara:strand:- start:10942 stop:12009 length:1068 start_codon:yes stop_codon:yes gene_type:complete